MNNETEHQQLHLVNSIDREDLIELVAHVKGQIDDECQAFEDDEEPGIQLTVGTNAERSSWGFQTGDNSYSGGAYGYPFWAVVGVYAGTSETELAQDIVDQLDGQIETAGYVSGVVDWKEGN